MWNNILITAKRLTLSTKLNSFQYSLLCCVLTTKVHRHKWNNVILPYCSFCKETDETILHLFIQCKIVRKLWKGLIDWLYPFCYIQLDIDPFEILFNKYKDSFAILVNTILLITKQYIYTHKCKSER